MADLNISNVYNISVSATVPSAGAYNTSNVGLFTDEVPANSFGTLGYALYTDPSQVGIDFGTSSKAYRLATKIFSQRPNILANRGYLAILPFLPGTSAVQGIASSGTPASGSIKFGFGGNVTTALSFNSTASAVQAALRALPGLEYVTVTGTFASGFAVTMTGVNGTVALITTSANTLMTSAPAAVTVTVSTTTPGVAHETLAAAIARTSGLVHYCGVMAAEISSQADTLAAAAVIQSMLKVAFFPSRNSADVAPGGMLDLLRTGSLDQSRGLLYVGVGSDLDALDFAAAYMSRAMSVDFSGSNTTITMHLKTLAAVNPDAGMTQTLLQACKLAGADIYASFEGNPRVYTSGANTFFDRVFNRIWFVGSLKIENFNFLSQVDGKVPQTEDGMTAMKAVDRRVCEAARKNRFIAPGEWTAPSTFGNLEDFIANIRQFGYYIYSSPVSQQLPSDRDARIAPLKQIAIKEAGAMHSGGIIVNVNA